MNHNCFYCTNEIEENESHLVAFYVSNEEREERLCRDCYQEWLQGIKG